MYKHQLELDQKKKKALNKQLEFLLRQTERYLTMLAENLVNSPTHHKPVNQMKKRKMLLMCFHPSTFDSKFPYKNHSGYQNFMTIHVAVNDVPFSIHAIFFIDLTLFDSEDVVSRREVSSASIVAKRSSEKGSSDLENGLGENDRNGCQTAPKLALPIQSQLQVNLNFILPFDNQEFSAEYLALSILKWKMQPYTPCNFIDYFLRKMPKTNKSTSKPLITISVQLILSTIKGIDFLQFNTSESATQRKKVRIFLLHVNTKSPKLF
ncbi:unnamed protein product [Fraxinus pennsylvanica]|uniref:Uncharacterized protein n=1 Tax=Fraxinus pennsylvanica TaxID=56036 RepID=A0AAD1ZLG9_9LAMI|nr:unnamed protein product [Fraxinus pennsylvanica]